ncbi:MAG: ABC transporter permease subunit [Anaerolineaceae bacterium]
MSRFPVFTKTIRDQRIAVLAWSIALVALGYVHVLMYPEYRDASSALSQTAYYQALAGEAGGIGTPGGYIVAEYFTGAPIMVLIFAIIAGTGAVAAEEAAGTLDLALAQPIRRTRLLLEKATALSLVAVLVSMASLPGLLLGKLFVDFDLSSLRLAEACLNIAPITLLYLAFAILGSAAIPSRTWATVVTIGAAIAGFFLETFGTFVSALDQVRKFSPFYWTNYGRVVAHGTDWFRDAAFVAVAVATLVVACVVFERRDVSSGTRAWPLASMLRRSRRSSRAETQAPASAARLPILRKTLRDQRPALLAWSTAILLLAFVQVVIYPQFRDAFEAFDAAGSFAPLAGAAGSVSSPAGYLALEFFSYIPLLILIAVVIAGTGVVAGDESAGTLDLVLSQPIPRWRVVAEKSAALVLVLLGMVAVSIPGLVAGKLLVDFDLGVTKLVAAAVFMVPLALLYLSLAIFGSAAVPSRTAGTVFVVGAAIAGYFLNTLGAFVDSLDQARKLSPFYWADFSSVMVNGFDWRTTIVFVAISAAFFAGAALVFERRDVSAVGASWPKLRRSRRR